MNRLAAFLALFLVSSSAFAAEPAALHWYKVAITGAGAEKSFTGSCSLDAGQIAMTLGGSTNIIVLENIRDVFAGGRDNLPFGWHPNDDVLKVYVPTRFVAYFVELPGDPAAKKP